MANPVVVRIVGEVQDLRAKLGQAAGDLDGFAKHTSAVFKSTFGDLTSLLTSRFGVIGSEAKKAMDGVATQAAGAGSALQLGIAGGAAAAAAALTALAASGLKDWLRLASQVREVQRIAGGSAEDASKLVAASKMVGVDADTSAAGMFRLARSIESKSAALHADGVVMAQNKDGSADLYGTLLSVSDAYKAAGGGAEGDRIAFDAFGKSGAALIPILAAGRDRLKEFADEAAKHHEILSNDDLEKARQLQVATAEAKNAWEGFKLEAGRFAVKEATGLAIMGEKSAEGIDKGAQAIGHLASGIWDAFAGDSHSVKAAHTAAETAAQKWADAEAAAGQEAVDAAAATAQALADEKRIRDELKQQLDDYQTELEDTLGADLKLASATASVSGAEQQLTDDLKGTGDQLGENTTKAQTYQDAQAALVDSVIGVDEAHVRARDAVRALNDELHKGAVGSENAAAYMKRYYEHGSAVADDHGDRVSSAAAQAVQAAEAEVEAMVKSGEIADTAAARKQALSDKLVALKEQFPEVATQIDRYNTQLGKVPNLSTKAEDSSKKVAKAKRDLAGDTATLIGALENEASHEDSIEGRHRKLIELLDAEKKKYPELAGVIQKYADDVDAAYARIWAKLGFDPTQQQALVNMTPDQSKQASDFFTQFSNPKYTKGAGASTSVTMNIFGAGDDPVTLGTIVARQMGWNLPVRAGI